MRKGEMMGKIFGIALVFLVIVSMVPFSIFSSQSQALAQEAKTWYVDDDKLDYPDADFTKIQDAVDAASGGDSIIVYPGTYTENVDVNKDHLTIQSENGAYSTTVHAADSDDHVFEVMADWVTISGFTVKGVGYYNRAGIHLIGANSCNVSGNIAFHNNYGIKLRDSSNNTLTDNNTVGNNYGIYLYCSSNSTVGGNTASYGQCGILLMNHSSDNTLSDNSVKSNGGDGISLYDSPNNTFSGNQVSNGWYGIYLCHSSNNTLSGNTISDNEYNFIVEGSQLSEFVQNIAVSNTVNGKPIQYLVDKHGLVIDSSWDVGYLGIVNCTDMVVKDLTCQGVLLAYSTDSRIEGVHASNNRYGIQLCHCSNNTLIGSNASNNRYGAYLDDSPNNVIYLTNFTDNQTNAHSQSSTSIWHSPEEITYIYNDSTYTNYLGNHWSDYTGSDVNGDGVGDTPYTIEFDADDSYPLMEPFENYEIGSAPKIWYVDDDLADYPDADFTNIQEAVDAASAGDTVKVYSGLYHERVEVNKTLTLCGIDTGGGKPVVDAEGSGAAITLSADGVTVEEFDTTNSGGGDWIDVGISVTSNNNTITDNNTSGNCRGIVLSNCTSNTIGGNTANSNAHGIWLEYSDNNTITDSIASNNEYDGIHLSHSNNNTITASSTTNNDLRGIFLNHSDNNTLTSNTASDTDNGIYLVASNNNTITANTVSDGSNGIHFWNSNNNSITSNTASNNYPYGMSLEDSSNNTITANTVSNNDYGIYLGSSSNNKIYLNNFINNNYNGRSHSSTNIWNSTELITYQYNGSTFTNYLGNYWSDYIGIDATGDGIGDIPYSINSDEDSYPLVEPFENYEIVHPSVSIEPTNSTVSPGAIFTIDVWLDAAGHGLAGIDVAVQYNSNVMTTTEDDVVVYDLVNLTLEMGPDVTEAAGVGEVSYQQVGLANVPGVDASVMTITFTVDENAEPGDYPLTIIKADLTDLTGIFEDTEANDGTVTIIGRKGDLDNDGDIDISDFVNFAAAYGSELGDDNYNPVADFDDDGVINIFDFVQFAAVYGT